MPGTNQLTQQQSYKSSALLMGNSFQITVLATDEAFAQQCIAAAIAEIRRIEALLTTFNEDSETARINQNAGLKPVAVSDEVFDLISRSQKIAQLTQGAFDLSYGSVDKSLWNFDVHMTALPDPAIAKKSVRLINYRNIILDDKRRTVYLKEKGMRIGFGGIGKGYAADKAKALLQRMGIESGVVNAAGDMATWGHDPQGAPWTVGIADPDKKGAVFSALNISNAAIATSGSYEKFATINGKRYSHTIDPKTGLPVSGIKSVSVISASAELADAMATPVMVMGVQAGLYLINQLKNMACIIIDDQNQLYTSNNINISRT